MKTLTALALLLLALPATADELPGWGGRLSAIGAGALRLEPHAGLAAGAGVAGELMFPSGETAQIGLEAALLTYPADSVRDWDSNWEADLSVLFEYPLRADDVRLGLDFGAGALFFRGFVPQHGPCTDCEGPGADIAPMFLAGFTVLAPRRNGTAFLFSMRADGALPFIYSSKTFLAPEVAIRLQVGIAFGG